MLQYTQIRHLHNTLPDSHTSDSSAYQKAMMALKFARSMAWEMVRVAIMLMGTEEAVSKVTLAGMCSTMRAGLAVLETSAYIDDGVVGEGEIEGYLRLLGWFAGRWTLGGEYLEKVGRLLGVA